MNEEAYRDGSSMDLWIRSDWIWHPELRMRSMNVWDMTVFFGALMLHDYWTSDDVFEQCTLLTYQEEQRRAWHQAMWGLEHLNHRRSRVITHLWLYLSCWPHSGQCLIQCQGTLINYLTLSPLLMNSYHATSFVQILHLRNLFLASLIWITTYVAHLFGPFASCVMCHAFCGSAIYLFTTGFPPFLFMCSEAADPSSALCPWQLVTGPTASRPIAHLALPSSSRFLQGFTLTFCFPHFMPAIIAFHQAFWILGFFQWRTQSVLSCCVCHLPQAKPSLLHGILSRPPLEQLPLCSQQTCQSSIAHSELRQTFVRQLAVWSRLHNLLPRWTSPVFRVPLLLPWSPVLHSGTGSISQYALIIVLLGIICYLSTIFWTNITDSPMVSETVSVCISRSSPLVRPHQTILPFYCITCLWSYSQTWTRYGSLHQSFHSFGLGSSYWPISNVSCVHYSQSGETKQTSSYSKLSFPLQVSPRSPQPSINSLVNSDDFPCTWGTFETVCTIIRNLPPGSQAATWDVAEAYCTIPLLPSQWPATVVRTDDDSFYVDTCTSFGMGPSTGAYGHIVDAGADLFRAIGIGPLTKWVNDHLFFCILQCHLNDYNSYHSSLHNILCHLPRRQTGGCLWFEGSTFDDGHFETFCENCKFPICDLSSQSVCSPEDLLYNCNFKDINRLSALLGIPWELSKDIHFCFQVLFIGLLWDLPRLTVGLGDAKKAKYLAAIVEWSSVQMHILLDIQQLYGKLLHACLSYPIHSRFSSKVPDTRSDQIWSTDPYRIRYNKLLHSYPVHIMLNTAYFLHSVYLPFQYIGYAHFQLCLLIC